jgi:hypothetical protein
MEFTNILTGQTIKPEAWQLALKPGDYYCIEQPAPAIIDQATSQVEFFAAPAVYGQIQDNEDCDPGFFWVEAFSAWCPDGEVGHLNICDPTHLLTEEEFNQAKANGWPTTFTKENQS